MTKRNAIIASVLLIISSLVINILIKDTNTTLNIELISFFSGFLFGIGIAFLFVTLFKKKQD
ncbi:MAG: hypothetical protein A2X13_02570 [Bacteroidetes bacterium GWC2_33_15]|nr:MAG: hypothetical protein A2X10_15015 [Bacteroidetes bacterium GWA2_33_15]OFX49376.1 MAG: hypothetical protein A2X13_02570 [Bacteroidetes bacterium GWC2_33_15]OFX63031.1 MAG: hypothetical protein A2X15_10300 [Bacteroidetes bacterium GWB2_32_14]OFX68724.1 MAG: hypothetical protein A2X14_14095 [Bacteroidetes bacterium GWD2_33_33]HAN19106.1 hypothetical protein [Bacteroidales bacterium]